MEKKKIFILVWLALIFSLACSLSDGATTGAVVQPVSTETPQAPLVEATPTFFPTKQSFELCMVSVGLLNMRTCAGTSCEVLAVLDEGDRLTVLELGDWLKVEVEKDDKTLIGFVNSNYCEIGE